MNIENLTVDVVIPVYRPKEEFSELIRNLERQNRKIQHIYLMHTLDGQKLPDIVEEYDNIVVEDILPEEFDHGGTRDSAIQKSNADIVVCMTQDALPVDEYLINELIRPLENEKIVVSYARQIPKKNCSLIECYTRRFNYPETSRIKSKKNISELGIKTYFCSNVCAMYDRKTYLELGGFVKKTIFNEDMIFAGNLIKYGYAIAYAADAKVVHSHNYTFMQQFHRNFDLAVSQADHPEIFAGVRSEGEGIRLVKKTALWLCRQVKPWLVVGLIWNSGWKYLGYLLGKRYRRLPEKVVLLCTMNKKYWKMEINRKT